jgi:hypothetical protein
MKHDSTVTPEDLELVAALLDGCLDTDERHRAIARIEADEPLREVLADTLRFREEGDRATGGSSVSRGPWRSGRWGWAAAAAAAVLALAVVWRLPEREPTFAVAELGRELAEPSLEAELTGAWYEQTWSVTRGPAPEALAPGAVIPFRLGVRAMDLEAALQAGRSEDAVLLTRRLEGLLGEVEGTEPQLRAYAEVRARLQPPAMAADEPRDLGLRRAMPGHRTGSLEAARLADRLNAEHPGFDGYGLGKWAEAGRLAALSGNAMLLRSRSFRLGLEQALEGGPDARGAAALQRLQSALLSDPRTIDMDSVARDLAEFIAAY